MFGFGYSPEMKVSSCLFLAIASTGLVHAASVSDPNIFNPGAAPATAVSTSEYSGGDAPSNAVDLTGNGQFFFGDGQAGDQTLSLTDFSAPSGIDTIRFFDTEEYEQGRLAQSVSIYTSTGATSSTSTADYTFLGTFSLPTISNAAGTNGLTYATPSYAGTSNGKYDYYDDVTDLGIGADTKSILFDFGTSPGIGYGFSEIEGFAAAPEPSTYALMGLGLAAFVLVARLRRLAA
jgi:hypothetical protein